MAIAWVNFRASVGTGDAADSIWNSGEIYSTGNPKIGGVYSQGWVAANLNVNDDTTYSVDHIRGFGSSLGGVDAATYRIADLVVGHVYRCYMAQALLFATQGCGFNIYSDNRTTVLYNQPGQSVPAGQIMDITGTLRSNATTWLAAQSSAYVDITATTTSFYICKEANNSRMNAFGIEDVTPAATGGSATLMMMGV